MSEVYGPTQFSLKIKAFKKPFLLHYAERNATTGRMEHAHATMGTPQDLIDFQVKLTAGKVDMIDGLSLTVQLFGVFMGQTGLLVDSGAEMKFILPEGPEAKVAPRACQYRRWESVSKGVPQGTTCGHPDLTHQMDCTRENCRIGPIHDDDRYW